MVPTPPSLENPGVPTQTLGIEKVLQSLNISNKAKEAANFKEPSMEGQEEGHQTLVTLFVLLSLSLEMNPDNYS